MLKQMNNSCISTTYSPNKNKSKLRWISFLCIVASAFFLTACSKEDKTYALATAHPLATKAGAEILEQGGNAFDAAIAVSGVLAVVEPYSSGFGGGGFWLLHRQSDNYQTMVDGRERAPGSASSDMYLDPVTGDPIPNMSLQGPIAAGIPGMPAALVHLAQNYAVLPLSRTLQAALKYAREGFPADERLIARLKASNNKLSPSSEDIFFINGQLPKLGQLVVQKDLANTIELLAKQGFNGFYRGQVAQKLVSQARLNGGIWQLKDLASYKVIEREPIQISYKGATITSASLPSAGGIVLAEILNMLSAKQEPFSDDNQFRHYLIETMRLAYRDRAKWLGDSDFVQVPLQNLLSDGYAQALSQNIDPNKAKHLKGIPAVKDGNDTTHFSIIDKAGNRVAATLSINYSFGSGFIARGTGVLLNNEMDDFSIKANVPNIYGLVGGKANMIEPNKRMLSSMSPTFIDDGKRIAVLGTPGGSRIITMVLLSTLSFLEGHDAQTIVSNKRFHHQYLPDVVEHEKGAFDKQTQAQLLKMGHFMKLHQEGYGNLQIVIWDKEKNKFDAASDPRGIGSAYID